MVRFVFNIVFVFAINVVVEDVAVVLAVAIDLDRHQWRSFLVGNELGGVVVIVVERLFLLGASNDDDEPVLGSGGRAKKFRSRGGHDDQLLQ